MNSTDVTADVVIANLLVNSEIVTNNIRAKDADFFTVNDNLVVTQHLTVDDNLTVDTITKRLANEVTVDCDFAVGGVLLVDEVRTSYAEQITIDDNVTVTGALTVNGTNILNAINNISLTPGPTGPQGATG